MARGTTTQACFIDVEACTLRIFDAIRKPFAGPAVKAFNTWDRATLIQKYGAAFYHEAPKSVVIAAMKTDKGWQIATE